MAIEPHVSGKNDFLSKLTEFLGKLESISHEELENLLGGNDSGHYHLTQAQYEWLVNAIEHGVIVNPDEPDNPDDPVDYSPVITENQVIEITVGEEMTPYEIQGTNLR